ncbi:hypothetical protein [Curtobacterium oceanosedimentum]|uniref:Uncharacterized protein n=1 Tax=Curtobacterium oceanosedimentum TaxID=465820 RepID=A0A147DQB8_9MICO|nr:hypothetical protein [Curtobacterium oceanosedimentum]KTR51703.1 hypothetical protein NS359_09195 [Curtobacterium oceanosedimentum]
MSPLVARWCLVGSAVVLVVVGVLADLAGSARVVLLAAAASCAVLDALTVRAPGAGPPRIVVTLPPFPVDVSDDHGSGLACATGGRESDHAASDHGLPTTQRADLAGALVLGRRPDGGTACVEVGPSAPCHVVVVGTGSCARAVFEALVAQLTGLGVGRSAGVDDSLVVGAAVDGAAVDDSGTDSPGPDVRIVTDDGPRSEAPPGLRPTPTGTAVAARLDDLGWPWVTVVLVPGVGLLPRRRDRVLEVTRHGCRAWDDGDGGAVSLDPVLPLLVGARSPGDPLCADLAPDPR